MLIAGAVFKIRIECLAFLRFNTLSTPRTCRLTLQNDETRPGYLPMRQLSLRNELEAELRSLARCVVSAQR